MADDLDPAAVERAARAHEVSLRGGVDMPDAVWVHQRDRYGLLDAMAAALAAARDGAWATDTDGGGPLCSSCGIGHDRGECTPAAPRHFAPYGSTNAACGETVPRRVSWGALGEFVDPRFTVRRVRVTCPECLWRLGLGPASDGETEQPVPDGRCANTMVVRCWAWCGREPEHEGLCEVGGITGRVQHAPVEPAVPNVTTEQVERLARQRADDAAVARGVEPWSDDSWAYVRHDLIQDEAARLRKAGIEVREP